MAMQTQGHRQLFNYIQEPENKGGLKVSPLTPAIVKWLKILTRPRKIGELKNVLETTRGSSNLTQIKTPFHQHSGRVSQKLVHSYVSFFGV